MLILRNIKKDEYEISADYYPENKKEIFGSVAVDIETGVLTRKIIVDHYETKENFAYCLHAAQGLMDIIECNEEIPLEKVVKW